MADVHVFRWDAPKDLIVRVVGCEGHGVALVGRMEEEATSNPMGATELLGRHAGNHVGPHHHTERIQVAGLLEACHLVLEGLIEHPGRGKGHESQGAGAVRGSPDDGRLSEQIVGTEGRQGSTERMACEDQAGGGVGVEEALHGSFDSRAWTLSI